MLGRKPQMSKNLKVSTTLNGKTRGEERRSSILFVADLEDTDDDFERVEREALSDVRYDS